MAGLTRGQPGVATGAPWPRSQTVDRLTRFVFCATFGRSMRSARVLLLALAGMLAACGSHGREPAAARLMVPVHCVADACVQVPSHVVGEAILWQPRKHGVANYRLLIDTWLAHAHGGDLDAWEQEAMFPGTCAKPARGRAYLNPQGFFPYSLAQLRMASWSIAVYDGTTMIGCGSHAARVPLQTNTQLLPDSAKLMIGRNRDVVSVRSQATGHGIIILTGGRDWRGSYTQLSFRFPAFGGSSDIVAALRRGSCNALRPLREIPLGGLSPDGEAVRASGAAQVYIPFAQFQREHWVVEFGGGSNGTGDDATYFGDGRSACASVSPP